MSRVPAQGILRIVGIYLLASLPLVGKAAEALVNPLSVPTLQGLLEGILAIVIVLAIPVVVFMLIYAGFLFVTARGNPQTIEQARSMLLYGVVGGVIIVSGYAIVTIVKNLVASF